MPSACTDDEEAVSVLTFNGWFCFVISSAVSMPHPQPPLSQNTAYGHNHPNININIAAQQENNEFENISAILTKTKF